MSDEPEEKDGFFTAMGLAEAIGESIVSSAVDALFDKVFGGSENRLSESDFDRIQNIVTRAQQAHDQHVDEANLKTLTQNLHEYSVGGPSVQSIQSINSDTTAVANMTTFLGYQGAEGYMYAISLHNASLSLSLQSDSSGKDKDTLVGENTSNALVQALKFEQQLAGAIPIDQFAYFKLYTFGEVPYSTAECPALAYFGNGYREVVQGFLRVVAKCQPTTYNDFFDPTKQPSEEPPHSPQLALRFFGRAANRSAFPPIWTYTLRADPHKDRTREWTAFVVLGSLGEYYPMGDIGLISPIGADPDFKVPGVRAISTSLPQATVGDSYWHDKGSGLHADLYAWAMSPPDSAHVLMANRVSGNPNGSTVGSLACLPAIYTNQQSVKTEWVETRWDYDVAVYKHPQFGDSGLFILDDRASNPSLKANCINLDSLQGHLKLTTPVAPDFDAGNWVGLLPHGSSGRWRAGNKVRYRASFYGPKGQSRPGPWWCPTLPPGAEASGYINLDKWSCPTLTNLSTAPAGEATGRIIYRQFEGRDEEVAGVIANNTDTRFTDTTDAPGYGPPLSGPDFDPSNWTGTAPKPGSNKWVSGYKVRYAVSFYGANGETPPGRWWQPTHWPGSDADGYYAGSPWANPTLTNIPIDLTNTATARIIYRQFNGGDVEIVGVIPDNTTTRFVDTSENAIYIHPLAAPDFDPGNWAGSVPIVGSKWQPGYKVRYAVSFYTADSETPMGPWWHSANWPGSDTDGYCAGSPWAYPTLTDIPVDPANRASGRRIYRQFFGGPVERVADIQNNTETRFVDTMP
jgi:hypothetical protein